MKRLTTWLWKEWRDHRAALLWTAVAIPAVTTIAFWAFQRTLSERDVAIFPPAALGVGWLAVSLDGFAREARRGTLAILQRTPGAFRAAFLAKAVVATCAGAATLLLEIGTLRVLAAITGLPDPELLPGQVAPSEEVIQGLPASVYWTAVVAAVGPWLWFASAGIPLGGVMALSGAFVLGALAAPLVWLAQVHGYYFVIEGADVFRVAGGAAILGLVACAITWWKGRRFHATGWRGVRLALLAVVPVVGAGYGVAAASLASWLDVRPDRDDFRIADQAFLGADGRHLYVNGHRGRLWGLGGFAEPGAGPGTPPLPLIVDLRDGTWRIAGDFGDYWNFPPVGFGFPWASATPLRWLHRVDSSRGRPWTAVTWFDANTADAVESGRVDVLSHDARVRTRETLLATTPLRDSTRRRAWMWGDELEKEPLPPDPRPGSLPWPLRDRIWLPVPGGCVSFDDADHPTFVDVETGKRRVLDVAEAGHQASLVGPDRYVRKKQVGPPESRWWLVGDTRTGEEKRTGDGLIDTQQVAVVGRHAVLLSRIDPLAASSSRLLVWDPVTDERRPVLPRELPVTGPDVRCSPLGFQRPDGSFLLRAYTLLGESGTAQAWGVFDPPRAEVRWLVSRTTIELMWPVAVDSDGSLLMVEDERRVVRYGPAPGVRTVLFPRGPGD